jgi:Poly A polymerase head domain/Probable RNA and SrmB- binding site of polymerase A
MRELAQDVLHGKEAWVVGGAVRDELLGRPVVDLDVVCDEPQQAARAYAKRAGAAVFPLSEQHGGWRVALDDGRTVDFLPLQGGSIEADLGTRDFSINAIAVPLAGGEPVDPFDGRGDLERRLLRAISTTVFDDDPLRLLRAARLEDELGFRLDAESERLVRERAPLVARSAGERVLEELSRLSADGYERLDDLGLLEPLGGRIPSQLRAFDSPSFRLAAVFGRNLRRLPISNELRRCTDTLLRAELPNDSSPRSIHRFRRATEPWALEALAFLGGNEYADAVREARSREPSEPLLRGDELGIPPGPEVGRLLELVAEERAAGTISTREEAQKLVRRSLG